MTRLPWMVLCAGLVLWGAPAALAQSSLNDLDALVDKPAGQPTPGQAAPAGAERSTGGAAGAGPGPAAGGTGGLDALLEDKPAAAPPAPAPAAAPAQAASGGAASASAGPRITFNGYVKPLLDLEFKTYPNTQFSPVLESNQYKTVGVRTQLLLQGALGEVAQFYSAVNLDFNEVSAANVPAARGEQGVLRLVEMYVDLFGDATRWRIGSQLVTWGFLDGFEVPTDRINALDLGFKSNELEDLKLASTGVQFAARLGAHKMELLYIPVGKVHRLPPELEAVYDEGLSADYARSVHTQDSKYAVQMSGTVGDLDYALSYVEGPNPWPDLGVSASGGAPVFYKRYRRYASPGLDLQYNFGSFLGKFAGAAFRPDDPDRRDPTLQKPWQQAMLGVEFFAGSALVSLSAGQKLVSDFDDSPANTAGNRLLAQPRALTNILAGGFSDSYLTGAALEVSAFFSGYWDQDGENVGYRFRPSFTYNLGNGLSVSAIPSVSLDADIRTQELYLETKYSF